MEAIAETLEHAVKIPPKAKTKTVKWEEFIVPKQIGGQTILTYPTFPMLVGLSGDRFDICDLKLVFNDRDEWERFPTSKISAPFAGGPRKQPTERITRFSANITEADFNALSRILDIDCERSEEEKWQEWYDQGYAAIYYEALQPKSAGYLTQLRIVSETTLQHRMGMPETAFGNFPSMPRQPVNAGQLMWLFIQDERNRWRWRQNNGQRLDGVFADDYWSAYLRFGIMKEDGIGGVLRIWSDAYLGSGNSGCFDED